jgi:hypothetical protein
MLGFNTPIDAKVVDGWADLGWSRIETSLPAGGHRIIVPPHAIRVAADGPNAGRVLRCVFQSGKYHVEFAVGEIELTAKSKRRFDIDDDILFHVEPDSVIELQTK